MGKVEELKGKGEWFKAGELAFELGSECYYGCHYGMRSTLNEAKNEFSRGWCTAQMNKINKVVKV